MPKYIKHMFADASKHPSGKKGRETEIINELFSKEGKKLVTDTSKPLFTEGLQHCNKDYIKHIK